MKVSTARKKNSKHNTCVSICILEVPNILPKPLKVDSIQEVDLGRYHILLQVILVTFNRCLNI